MTRLEDHAQWPAVKDVCLRLQGAGFQALLAGGSVRDLIMNREPNDFDVATSATPDQVEALFEKSLAVGKAFGVIVIPFDDFQIEVATFREDLEYTDGRRPDGVRFATPEADAKRRDFTVNALFYDVISGQILDFVDGQRDIASRILRTVGDPNQRFDEDKLRLLRAIRFAAQLDFEIEPNTLSAITARANEVSVVSHERIRDELLKLLRAPNRARGLRLLLETGVLAGCAPGLAKPLRESSSEAREVWIKTFEGLSSNVHDIAVLLALFLAPASRDAKSLLQNLKLHTQTSEAVTHIFRDLESLLFPSKTRLGERAFVLTKPHAFSLLEVAGALVKSGAVAHEPEPQLAWTEALSRARPDGKTAAAPLVTGRDLIRLGVKAGPQMGSLLHDVYLRQLEGLIRSREEAEAWIVSRLT